MALNKISKNKKRQFVNSVIKLKKQLLKMTKKNPSQNMMGSFFKYRQLPTIYMLWFADK